MIAAFGFGLLGLFLWQSAAPPDISGRWTGEDWGQVVLEEKQTGKYEGTYSDTFGEEAGTLELKWSRIEGRFKGNWGEGKDRFGKISVRLVGDEIRGAWTTNKKSGIHPGTPELADLLWVRSGDNDTPKRVPGTVDSDGRDAKRRSYMLEFSGRQTYVDFPGLRYDGSHPITIEATVMSLYRGSIIADFSGAGLGLSVADGYCSFHVNDGRKADNGYIRVKSNTSVGRGKPVHIAGVLNGRKLSLFVDGKLQGSETIGNFNKSTFPLMIGADPGGQGEPTKFLNGFIDEVRVSKNARYAEDFTPPSKLESDKQTMVLYPLDEGEGNVAHDASGNGLHGKIHHAKWVAAREAPRTAESLAIQRLRQIGVTITEKNGVATGFTFGNSAKITDADLAMLESLSSLEDFTLVRCNNVTDAGFSQLKHLTRLQTLNLSPSNITDTGLANVKGVKVLWRLSLNSPGITDAGMVHLTHLSSLKHIILSNTQVTAAGLTHLATLKNLKVLELINTQITPNEFEELRKLLPKDCEIQHSFTRQQQTLPIEVPTPTTLPGHENHVNSSVFSPDGKTLAAGDYAGTVILWDVSTQRKLRSLNNIQPIECVVFSPDGKTLVTADRNSAITFWDVETGRELKKVKEHTSAVMSVAYSPEGEMLASAGVDNTVKIWDSASGEVRATLSGHTNAIQEVKFSRDGRKLASVDLDGA